MSTLNFTLERVSQPAIEALTLAQLKLHLRTYTTDTAEDDLLTTLIQAAREWVEDYTGRVLIDSTWRLNVGEYVNAFANVDSDTVSGYYAGVQTPRSDGSILLHKSPVIAITSFVSVDSEGAETVIDPATYELRQGDGRWPIVHPLAGANWTTGPLRIEYRAGYADQTGSPQTGAEVVPERFRQAMLLWCEALYDREEKMMQILLDTAERLIRPERVELQMA